MTRNVVLVTVDSFRSDARGGPNSLTPAIDNLADDGIVYENAIAPGPSTAESMPALFTGTYPVDRSLERTGKFDDRVARIKPHMRRRETIAERFSNAGYQTAAFTPNPFTSRHFGFDSGFDHFEDFLGGSRHKLYEKLFKRSGKAGSSFPLRILLNMLQKEEAFKPWESFYDKIISWVDATPEPFFLWVFLMDAHHPYLAPRDSQSQSLGKTLFANWRLRARDYEPPLGDRSHEWLQTAYEDAVRHVDRFIDQLYSDLASTDPIYVVTSDHGETFDDHGVYEHRGGALGQHGNQESNHYLYDEVMRVPFVIGNTDCSDRITEPVPVRRLKELFRPGEEPMVRHNLGQSCVVSRTFDAAHFAVRGQGWTYLDMGTEDRVFTADDRSSNDHDELRTVGRQIARRHRRTDDLMEQTVDAAGQFMIADLV